MGQAGMKNNWKRNTRYMGVFAVLAAVFCMIVVLNINTGNVQISVPEILRILFLTHGHLYSPENLPPLDAGDVLAYGHTHIPVAENAVRSTCLILAQ